jgi:hypothetical protein
VADSRTEARDRLTDLLSEPATFDLERLER